jgi:hypothetical protein
MILWEDGVEHTIDARTGAHRAPDHLAPQHARLPDGDRAVPAAPTAGIAPASTLGDR